MLSRLVKDKQTGGAQFSGMRKPARSRGASSSDVPRKQQRAGEEEAVDADVTDLITQVHLKLSAQLEARVRDLESSTCCTLFPPKESDIAKETQNAGRCCSDMVEIKPDMERGSPHIWLSNAMLGSTERILKTESGELSLPDEEKAEALTTLRINHRRGEVLRAEHVDKTMHLPTFVKPGQSPQVAGHLCSRRIHFLQTEEAARRGGVPPLRAVGGDTGNAGRGTKQEEDKDSGLGRAHHDTVQSGCPAGESSVRESGKRAGQGDHLGKRKGTGPKGSVPIVSDGINQLSALTQRLLNRWRSRRQSVSEHPRSERESELSASRTRDSSGPTRRGT